MELQPCNSNRAESSLYEALHGPGRVPAGYLCKLYPKAREAVITFSPSWQTPESSRGPSRAAPESDTVSGVRVASGDGSRQVRRAMTTVRRYAKANGLDRLLTLTYRPPFCTDPEVLRTDLRRFIRRLRRELGCERFPYVWVPEFHADGIRFHAHLGLGRYIKRDRIERCWPHGNLDIRRITVRNKGSKTERASRVAQYLTKYVSKAFADTAAIGCHRYDVAQRFQPKCERLVLDTEEHARQWAIMMMGGEIPANDWSSRSSDTWDGPECRTLAWD